MLVNLLQKECLTPGECVMVSSGYVAIVCEHCNSDNFYLSKVEYENMLNDPEYADGFVCDVCGKLTSLH